MHDLLMKCAQVYLDGKHEPGAGSYQAFVAETRGQFKRLPVMVDWTPVNPYESAPELFADCARGRFAVYSGGSGFASGHPLALGDRNLQFRAVHDWNGHYGSHNSAHYDFSFEGELRAWLRHDAQYSDSARNALFCETVLQLAVYAATGDFVEMQKCVVSPDALINEVRQYAATLAVS